MDFLTPSFWDDPLGLARANYVMLSIILFLVIVGWKR